MSQTLDPSDDSLPPGIDQADGQGGDEEDDLDKAEEAQLLEDHRPRQDKDDIHVKGHKQQGEDVKCKGELDPGRANGCLARLIRGELVLGGPALEQERVEQIGREQTSEDETHAPKTEEGGEEISGGDHGHLLDAWRRFERFQSGSRYTGVVVGRLAAGRKTRANRAPASSCVALWALWALCGAMWRRRL